MKKILLLLLTLASNLTYGQLWIKGVVIDQKTKETLPGVSVYLNNTTIGTTTDSDGKFSLGVSIPGKIELVASYVGYVKQTNIIENYDQPLRIELKPQQNTLKEVVIKAQKQKKEDVTRWINLFTLNLIGRYDPLHVAKLKNSDDLYFSFDRRENRLYAFAKAPLIIENEFLAYDVRIDLDKFEYALNTNVVDYSYSCFYENKKSSKLSKDNIIANRKLAYEGSTLHFMRSVFQNALEQQHFLIEKYNSVRNKEKERVSGIIARKIADAYAEETVPNLNLTRFFSRDSVRYYDDVMRQGSILSFKTWPVDIRKIARKDRVTRTVNLDFPDTLQISYEKTKLTKEQHMAAALEINKDNPKVIKPVYLLSYLYFFKSGGINIQQNGYYPEASVFMSGDMPERRIGMSVPLNFDPEDPLQ